MIKQLLAILFVALIGTAAYAEVRTGTLVPPTQRENGEPLPQSEIAGYKVFLNGNEVSLLSGNATGFSLDLLPGTHSVYLRTVDTDGNESANSNTATTTVESDKSNPNAPAIQFTIGGGR